ncbi:MAG: three-Cys-motif partner protein TcmP [Planctomycetota bacterium]|jgi:three-Cys-motif partner protein
MSELPTPQDDDLCIPEVPEHSKYKHHFIRRYIDAFTTSMKDKRWSGLHYIDLFAGAGIERLRNSRKLDWGSPLIAAQAPYPFTKLHLCEKVTDLHYALEIRVKRFRSDSQIIQGDANKKISQIVSDIPKKSLSLSFLDPHGFHLEFQTLKTLASIRTDLIIFFPDRLDALRNWAAYYLDNPESNLDRYLGSGIDWRERMSKTPSDHRAEVLRDMYIRQIREQLGYSEFDCERITTTRGNPLYFLIFCSRSPTATRLWRQIAEKKPDGQRTFKFEP